MTKKHFIALADAIRHHNECAEPNFKFKSIQLHSLAQFCAEQNPHFNRKRWLDYIAGECGPNGGVTGVERGKAH